MWRLEHLSPRAMKLEDCQMGGYLGRTSWESWPLNRCHIWVDGKEGMESRQWHMERSHGDEKNQALGKG